MIRHPLGLRLDAKQPAREQIHEAARLGARGVVIDSSGDLAPHRLSDTGRRELRHLLKSVELSLVAIALPTRRPFDTPDQLDDRVRRADSAFAMAYELGTKVVLLRAGRVPPEDEPARREAFTTALRDLGNRAEHRGVRLALETASEPVEALEGLLGTMGLPGPRCQRRPGSGALDRRRPCRLGSQARNVDCPRVCQRCRPRFQLRRTQPARIRVSAGGDGLGRIPGCSGRDWLSRFLDDLAGGGPTGCGPVCRDLAAARPARLKPRRPDDHGSVE